LLEVAIQPGAAAEPHPRRLSAAQAANPRLSLVGKARARLPPVAITSGECNRTQPLTIT